MGDKDDHQRCSSKYKNEKIKSRNLSEKKRRDQFNMLINELSSIVPSTNRKMDKSSVLRSAILFLRTHCDYSVQSHHAETQENWKPSFLSNEEFTHLMLEAIDGFIIVLSCTGRILYSSESMASLLGYFPGKMCSSIFDMVHENDKASLYKLLSSASSSADSFAKDFHLSLAVHIKRGPLDSFQQSVYELVHLGGMFHRFASYSEGFGSSSFECDSSSYSSSCSPVSSTTSSEWHVCFVAVAKLQVPQVLRVVNFFEDSKNEFTSRHSLEWTFLFLDHRLQQIILLTNLILFIYLFSLVTSKKAPSIIGYLPFEVLGTSGYEYYHVDDLENIAACHKALIRTGEGMSCFYRFLTKGQQWIWLQTRYYVTYHQWNSKPEFIVCTHSVVNYSQVQDAMCKWPREKENFGKNVDMNSTINGNCYSSSELLVLPQEDTRSYAAVRCFGVIQKFPNWSCKAATPFMKQSVDFHAGRSSENSGNLNKIEPYWTASVGQIKESEPGIETTENSTNRLLTVRPSLFKTASIPPVLAQETSQAVETSSDVTTTTVEPFMRHPNSFATSVIEEQCQTTTKMTELQPALPRTSGQSHLQDFLRRRHQLLQQQIIIHQEELRRVSEQLKLVQYTTPFHDAGSAPCQRMSATPDVDNAAADTSSAYNPHGDPVQQSTSAIVFNKDDGKCHPMHLNDQQHQITAAILKIPDDGVTMACESQRLSASLIREHSPVASTEDCSLAHSLQ